MPLDVFGTVRGGASTISSGGVPATLGRNLLRALLQRRACGGIGLARLGQNDHPFGAGCAVGRSEHRDAALADARNFGDGFFDFLRIDVPAGADDDVLDPAGYVNVAAGHVGAVAAVEPAVVEKLARLRLVAEIARGRRRPAELQPAFVPLANLVAQLVHDADFVARQGQTAATISSGCASSGRAGAAMPRALNASRSTRSMTGARPRGGNARPTEFSARP